MRRLFPALALVLAAAGACGGDHYLVVTVSGRPAVHGATKLRVVLSNEGSMRTDERDLGSKAFPVTLAIDATGRSGDLGITIDALDASGFVVGHGVTSASVEADDVDLMLDSADFVVNTDVANDQFVSDDFEAVGLQLAATTEGKFTVAYRDYPCTNCDIYARRFDATGAPITSDIAAGPGGFKVTTTLTTSSAQAAAASAGTKTIVAWDFTNTVGAGTGIACRGLDETGAAMPSQISLSNDASADVVSAAGMMNTNFAVTWTAFLANTYVIRTTIARPDCSSPLSTPVTVSTTAGSFGARRPHVAANNGSVLYAWILDGQDAYIRVGNLSAGFPGAAADTKLIAHTATQTVDHVRVAPLGTGFAVLARWSTTSGNGPGKIELYQVMANGTPVGPPTLVTDKSGSDFASDKAFGVATGNGKLLVSWHQCDNGLGSCDVWGRYFNTDGTVSGDAFLIPTTTAADQLNPSVGALPDGLFVAAWNDASGTEPDHSGSAVRARILYPPTGSP
jgi:hypothetical protein